MRAGGTGTAHVLARRPFHPGPDRARSVHLMEPGREQGRRQACCKIVDSRAARRGGARRVGQWERRPLDQDRRKHRLPKLGQALVVPVPQKEVGGSRLDSGHSLIDVIDEHRNRSSHPGKGGNPGEVGHTAAGGPDEGRLRPGRRIEDVLVAGRSRIDREPPTCQRRSFRASWGLENPRRERTRWPPRPSGRAHRQQPAAGRGGR